MGGAGQKVYNVPMATNCIDYPEIQIIQAQLILLISNLLIYLFVKIR